MQNDEALEKILGALSEKPSEGMTRVFNRYTHAVEEIKLSRANRVALAVKGEAKVEERTYPGWSGKLPFFAYTVDIGGKKVLLFDYRHGYEDRLDCYI